MTTLLVPLDGSEFAAEVLGEGLELYAKEDLDLIVIQCIDYNRLFAHATDMSPQTIRELQENDESCAQSYLDLQVSLLRERGYSARALLVDGSAVEGILRTAQQHHVDQILLATHGRGGVARVLLGSVAEAVVRRADRPVMVVASSARCAHLGLDPIRDRNAKKRLLIPLDGTAFAEAALSQGLLDPPEKVEIVVFHCTDLNQVFGPPRGFLPHMLAEVHAQSQAKFQAYLDRQVGLLKERGYTDARALLATGNPTDGILKMAQEENVDVIQLTTHGRMGLARIIMGSVAEGVIRHAAVPVLIVPPADRASGDGEADDHGITP